MMEPTTEDSENEINELELMELFTFAREEEDSQNHEIQTDDTNGDAESSEDQFPGGQDPWSRIRPVLLFGWKLLKWPLLFVMTNLALVVGLAFFVGNSSSNFSYYGVDIYAQQQQNNAIWFKASVIVLFAALIDTAVLVSSYRWLYPQMIRLQGRTAGSQEQQTEVSLSPQAHSLHSLDIYLIRRNLRRRRRRQHQPVSTSESPEEISVGYSSKGFVLNMLALGIAGFLLVLAGSALILTASLATFPCTKITHNQTAHTQEEFPAGSSVVEKLERALPKELHFWINGGGLGPRGPYDYNQWFQMSDNSLITTSPYGHLLRVSPNSENETAGAKVVSFAFSHILPMDRPARDLYAVDFDFYHLNEHEEQSLPLNVSRVCWFQLYGIEMNVGCYKAADEKSGSESQKYTIEIHPGCREIEQLGLDESLQLWMLGQGRSEFYEQVHVFRVNLTEASATLQVTVDQFFTGIFDEYGRTITAPVCMLPYIGLFVAILAGLTICSGAVLVHRNFASGGAFVLIGITLLFQATFDNETAGVVASALTLTLLGRLLWGAERPPYLHHEQQCWALYGLLGFAWIDIEFDWFSLPVFLTVFLGQFVLNHPVLPLLASLSAIVAALFFAVGIVYPPLLPVGLLSAILSAGMFVVDRQWIMLRPYAVFYLQKVLGCCRGRLETMTSIARSAMTAPPRTAD